ncbi:MAG: DsrE/DsrF/DrsH-like family protein [Desulfobacterales bacterium]|nr:DsrE/DsrF/DrsH-like family protein [Desulfobacterales bacterium]
MTEERDLAIVLSEGSYDKALSAFMLATTAAAMGKKARIFFTFWGLSCVQRGAKPKFKGMMRPFTGMFESKMKAKKIPIFVEFLEQAKELNVELYACSTTMELMGIKKENLLDGTTIVGAAGFLQLSENSKVLFIG